MQTLVNYIIRPKRNTYDPNLHLGPAVFLLDNSLYCGRMDFEVKNRKGKTLKCSIYHRNIEWNKQYPLIVYCHGNSGNRTDSFGPLYWMLKNNIFLLAFDFSGCGISEGDYVSLGYYEHFDIEDVLNHVLENYDFIDVKKVGLWGRSMGSVASILFASRTKTASLMVLDSPFSDFPTLVKENMDKYSIISKLAGNYIYKNMRTEILEQAKFDFEDLKPLVAIKKCTIPTFFAHGKKDTLIRIDHSKKLYEAYPNKENVAYLEFDLDHNDSRSDPVYNTISQFILDTWGLRKTKKLANKIRPMSETMITSHSYELSSLGDKKSENKDNEEDLQEKDDVSAQRPINRNTKSRQRQNSPTNDRSISEKMPQSFKPKVSVFQSDKNSRHPLPSKLDYDNEPTEPDNEEFYKVFNILDELKKHKTLQQRNRQLLKENRQKRSSSSSSKNATMRMEDANISADDMLDLTELDKKKSSISFINSAASKKFESFRNKKLEFCLPNKSQI